MNARCLFLAVLLAAPPAAAQMERQRAVSDPPVEYVFWAPSVITTRSVTNLPAGTLNFTIHHAFAPVSEGAGELFGLDGRANIRIGLDYGVTDGLSVGVGRTRFSKVWDGRAKLTLLRQTRSGSVPVSVALAGGVGVDTERPGLGLVDRLSTSSAVIVARQFGGRLSLQAAPMLVHFNTVFDERVGDAVLQPQNTLVALGLGAQLRLTAGAALLAEYVPVLGARSDGTADALAVGAALDTGGHVFQLFLTASPWATEEHTVGRNTDRFLEGDFRIGFTVNRVFGVGGR